MFCLSEDDAGCLPVVEPAGLLEGETFSFLLLPVVVVGLLFEELCPTVPRDVLELVPVPRLTTVVLLVGVSGALISVSRRGV